MRIAVIGAGTVGTTLARKWLDAGHDVVVGSRRPDDGAVLDAAASIGPGVHVELPADAAAGADAVVFTVPGTALADAVAPVAGLLDGTVVVNATNVMGPPGSDPNAPISAAAPGALVVRAFNTLGVENFADPVVGGVQADLFWAGPDEAVEVAETLIADCGLRPVRVEGDRAVALVDDLFQLWIQLAMRQGHGRRLAFKMLTEEGA